MLVCHHYDTTVTVRCDNYSRERFLYNGGKNEKRDWLLKFIYPHL